MKSYGVTIQMKATEQYFPVVLFIMLYKVVLTDEFVDEILKCDNLNKSNCSSNVIQNKLSQVCNLSDCTSWNTRRNLSLMLLGFQ